ncbi:hypothetical protein [uncultured Photobacterium sp.]|uniref:hypothetical protein n=1 Tax=uncultured Photobacterium sp. TaxID=173973 RepID=UPI00261C9B3A|nr:hypothetical protein [uncultured Photobacterium sp.]
MLITLFRALMLMICLGATSFAHADCHCSDTVAVMPTNASQHIVSSANYDPVLAQLDAYSDSDKIVKSVDAQPLVWDFPLQSAPKPAEQHSSQTHGYDLALTNCSRMANLMRHDPEEVQPLYQLAIELPVEPVPSFEKGYSINFSDSLNWVLNTQPTASRLSGWKESNLTYTVYHHHILSA